MPWTPLNRATNPGSKRRLPNAGTGCRRSASRSRQALARGGRDRPLDKLYCAKCGSVSQRGKHGVLDIEGDDPVVIHAQPLRPKFHRFLG